MPHAPSDEQALIYKHTRLAKKRKTLGKRSNFVIDAKAGSGKTYTLIQSINGIVAKYPTDSIIVMMFNKHNQVDTAAKLAACKNAKVQTTYSAGLAVLRDAKMTPKLNNSKYYFICKELIDAKRDVILSAFKPAGLSVRDLNPEQIKSAITKATSQLNELVSMAMNTLSKLDSESLLQMCETYEKDCEDPILLPMVRTAIELGMEALKSRRLMSFSDMIYGPIYFNLKFPHFDWVLIDEAQDLNAAQLDICMRYAKNAIAGAVGDERQAIMAFTGAMSDGMMNFKKKTRARSLSLDICYRCPSKVLDLARLVVPSIKDRPDCPEGNIEAISQIEITEKAQPGDFVICRITAPLVKQCINFIKIGKPARVKGRDIGKQLTDLYKSIVESCDCQTVDEFIGGLAEYADNELAAALVKKFSQARIAAMQDSFDCLHAIANFVSEYNVSKGKTTHHMISAQIDKLFDDEITKQFVLLCTVHRSKGLEGDNIFIMEFDKMPFTFDPKKPLSPEKLRQELNLIYVGITRAMKNLYISGKGFINILDVARHISNLTGEPLCGSLVGLESANHETWMQDKNTKPKPQLTE